MKSKDSYDYDIMTVKKFGDNTVKVTYMSACRLSGVEDDRNFSAKGTVNDTKLENNIVRAKSRVKELILCNPWDYWCTFTISPHCYDRYNLKTYFKDFSEFIHGYNRRCSDVDKVRYIFLPEMHKDGAWHLHGFVKGIRKSDICINQNGYLTWKQYNDKFGFISMDTIKDIDRCSSYIMKYMTKDISRNVSELGSHLYYCSKGLNKSELIYRGKAQLHCPWDWEHPDGYCKVKTFDTRSDDLECCLEIIE